MVGRFEGATWKRGTDNFAIAGVRAYQFMMDKPPVTKTSSKALNGRVKNFKSLQGASLWVASDIQTPPEVSNLLSQIYGVPDCQRIPLRVVVNEVGVGKSTAVDTLKISHLSVPDSAFAVPNGYQIAKTDTEVFIDKESADTIDEMLQDLDKPSTPRGHATQSYQRPGQATQRRY